ncbi:MAG: amidophosphoribosyltransferase [Spirochaetales bacterium]|nr:amidophosphoribosyltransferase [Spirochaetales bacterium]
MKETQDSLKHFCGIVGLHSRSPINIPHKLFYTLFSLQHRGQESAGITYRKEDKLVTYKDLGKVSDVLTRYLTKDIHSEIGIGHVRYSTFGGNKVENAQPITISCNKGEISLAHNGNISNASEIRKALTDNGAIFQSTSDSEIVLHLIAKSKEKDFLQALTTILNQLEGAFCFTIIFNDMLIAVRDPNGFRPLYIGEQDGITLTASETCAFDSIGITNYRQVEAGEMVIIDKSGQRSIRFSEDKKKHQCIFELIYFARPDSYIFNHSVYLARKKMGAMLAKADGKLGDIVMAVPESGNSAAIGYAQEANLPFEFGLTRNFYVGRSFILPTTEKREMAVRTKLNPVREIVKGKKVILIDDSLVRGTTSKILVKILREAGAAEIHLRLSAPELHFPCYYGIDIPTKEELISNSKSPDEIAKFIGADSVKFIPIDDLRQCIDDPDDFCYACFNGDHPYQHK